MKIFMTGATGFIGRNLALRLVTENHQLMVLLRDRSKGSEFMQMGAGVAYGSLSDKDILCDAMNECDIVFHLAAYTKPASKDPLLPYRINVEGTINVLEAAREKSVRKVIITSTAGTLGYSEDGKVIDEKVNTDTDYHTEYERTKAEAENMAIKYNSDSMEVVVLNPTRVFGPGKISLSNSVTRIISLYGKGLWRILPGNGDTVANYVYIEDVVNGHILAAVKGTGGERYILGGENISYREFFNVLGDIYKRKRKLVTLNESVLKWIVKMAGMWSRISGRPVFITNAWVDKYLQNSVISSRKASDILGYKITPFHEGAEKTVQWLKSQR